MDSFGKGVYRSVEVWGQEGKDKAHGGELQAGCGQEGRDKAHGRELQAGRGQEERDKVHG